MKFSLKTYFGIVAILLLAWIVFYALRLKYLWDNVEFDFDISGLNILNINLFGTSQVEASIDFFVKNPTTVRLVMNDISAEVYKDGVLLARLQNIKEFAVYRRRENLIKAKIDVFVNKFLIDTYMNVMNGFPQELDLRIRLKILGIPVRVPYKYKISKEDFE